MPKLTAEMFSKLPEELQQKILTEVPVEALSRIEVLTPDDIDADTVSAGLHNLLVGLSKRKAICMLIEMSNFITQQSMEGAPVNLRMAASLSILQQVAEVAEETMRKSKENDDD